MATATAPRNMELQLVNGMVLKVQLEEMAGGVGERVAALEAKLREQGDAMAAMQRDMAETSRAMALLKGMAATGALGEKIAGEGAGNGSASGEAAEGIGAEPRKNIFAALEVEEVKARVETMRAEARDVASELRGEMGALKAEIARMRAAAERQAAEVAYVKATEAHSEARINDVELALAAIKDGQAEKSREGRNEGSGGEGEGTERREGKRRKREEVGEKVGVIAAGGAPEGKRDAEEREGEAQGVGNGAACDTKAELKGLRERVEALEAVSAVGGKTWEALMALWSEAIPGETQLHLGGIPFLTDAALTEVANLRSLTSLTLGDSTGFTEAGVRGLFSLTNLTYLNLRGTATTDAALDGVSGLKKLERLFLESTRISDAGIVKLQEMTALKGLFIGDCGAVTSAGMVNVGKMTGLESLALSDTGVTEDGLQHLTALTALKLFILPPGVTDSSMKRLRNMKRLEKLGIWDATITAAGIKWLKGLKWLQTIGTDAEDVAELIRDIFPGMIVTPGPLE